VTHLITSKPYRTCPNSFEHFYCYALEVTSFRDVLHCWVIRNEFTIFFPLYIVECNSHDQSITFGFCYTQNDQGLGKGYQPYPYPTYNYLNLAFFWISQKN